MKLTDRWRGRLLILAIFACGAVAGGAAVQLRTTALIRELIGGPASTLEARVKLLLLERGLSLTAAQREQIRPILEESAIKVRAARQVIEPELAGIRQSERSAVRARLTPAQREEYDRRLVQIDAALGR